MAIDIKVEDQIPEALLYASERYAGECVKSRPHGCGVMISSNGVYYEGQFKDGKRDGVGIITWADGERFVGEFRDGSREGIGELISAEGVILRGEWKNDERHGHQFTINGLSDPMINVFDSFDEGAATHRPSLSPRWDPSIVSDCCQIAFNAMSEVHKRAVAAKQKAIRARDEALRIEVEGAIAKYEMETSRDEWNTALAQDLETLTRQKRISDTKRKKTERKIAESNVYMGSLRKELSELGCTLDELQPWGAIHEKKTRELFVLDTKLQRLNGERIVKDDFLTKETQKRVAARKAATLDLDKTLLLVQGD